MSKNKFTEGEWAYDSKTHQIIDCSFEYPQVIADVVFTEAIDNKNGYLLASATDLLEACELALEFFNGIKNGEMPTIPDVFVLSGNLEKAIQKARGENE